MLRAVSLQTKERFSTGYSRSKLEFWVGYPPNQTGVLKRMTTNWNEILTKMISNLLNFYTKLNSGTKRDFSRLRLWMFVEILLIDLHKSKEGFFFQVKLTNQMETSKDNLQTKQKLLTSLAHNQNDNFLRFTQEIIHSM